MSAWQVFIDSFQTVLLIGILFTLVGFRKDRWGR